MYTILQIKRGLEFLVGIFICTLYMTYRVQYIQCVLERYSKMCYFWNSK
jgi:hypothetical protein